MKNQTKIILLGTGTPNAEPDRSGPSVALMVDQTPYIFDFGPGVIRRAAEAGLPLLRLSRAFLTHLHSDHTAGYPDLILTPWTLGRVEPLVVYGPPGIQKMTEHILEAYEEDIKERLNGLEPANKTGYHVHTHEITPGTIYEDSRIQVEAFPVDHGLFHAYAFKVITPDRVIVISGDTAPTRRMVEESLYCDVLIHEVYSIKGFQNRPPDWQEYHQCVHTSSHELAALAREAAPDLVILYHQLFWGVSDDELLAEIKDIYDGKVVSGKDLEVY
jgi:ribonuclease BN (tRNA processing enzyme)